MERKRARERSKRERERGNGIGEENIKNKRAVMSKTEGVREREKKRGKDR